MTVLLQSQFTRTTASCKTTWMKTRRLESLQESA